MSYKLKSIVSVAAAGTVAVGACLPLCGSISAETEAVIRPLGTYEAEELDIGSQDVWTSVYEHQLPGYSGDGFIYLSATPFSMSVEVEEDGMYEIATRCAQILSQEGRDRKSVV